MVSFFKFFLATIAPCCSGGPSWFEAPLVVIFSAAQINVEVEVELKSIQPKHTFCLAKTRPGPVRF